MSKKTNYMLILINEDTEAMHFSTDLQDKQLENLALDFLTRYDNVLIFEHEAYHELWGNLGLQSGPEVVKRIELYG